MIFNFFKSYTAKKQPNQETKKIGFGIYYSQERRKKILDAIYSGKTSTTMSNTGKKIIGTYTQQLDLQIKRIKQERKAMEQEGMHPEPSDFMTRRIAAYDRNAVDPDNLKSILNGLMSTNNH